MKKNQVKGAGKLIGNNEQQAKGINKNIYCKAEKVYGDVKEAVKDATRA
jgi:uncharacterized protein YjbJ (UPF0337 family)